MDEDTLNSILNDNVQPDPNFLQDKVDEIQSNKPIDETTIHCDEPGCDASFSGTMARAQLGRHKSAKHGIKKEVEQKTKGKLNTENLNQIPTSSSYLEELLEGFAIPNRKGILLALKDDSQNIDELREALKSVRVDKNTADYIVKKYASSVGKNVADIGTPVTEPQISPLKATVGMLNDSLQVQLLQNMLQPKQSDTKNPELEQMKLQMASMVEQNKRLEALLTQQKVDNEINLLKKALEDSKREYGGQLGSLSDSMKEFVTAMMNSQEKMALQNDNKFEKLILQMQHKQETDELKKEVEIAKANSNKSFIEKGLEVVDKKLDAAGQVFGMAAKQNIDIEKAQTARDLINQGVPKNEAFAVTGLANGIIQNNMRELDEIEAHKELKKLADELNKQPVSPQPQPQPQTQPEPIVEPQPEPIKFATGPDER